MFQTRPPRTTIEPLEARIAPALAVLNPLADLIVGPGKTGAEIDLSRIFDPIIADNGHTIVTLQTNFDSDPNTAGLQASSPIVIELFDDVAPLTVQNFLSYLVNADPKSNYKGTIFHRAFNFSGSGTGADIIQGGGFNVLTPGAHIPTLFDVHNEYSDAYPNVRGTIAMAKTGLGPNTGSSEWFINNSDNSTTLGGTNNGGFTVFGRVLLGLEVADGIATLPTFNFSGASSGDNPALGAVNGVFRNLPLQNYSSDPDSNPNTPARTPSQDNVITLTSVSVSKAPSGTLTGVTYSVNPSVDIVDATTGLISDLVTATVTGSQLRLNYKPHAAGAVRITVHGSDGASSSGEDTFVVDLQPNLVANFEQDPFDVVIVGGDMKASNIVIGNNGGGWAVGSVDVKVYLQKFTSFEAAVILDPAVAVPIAEFLDQPIDIAGGGTITLARTLNIPQMLVTKSSELYRVLVEVTPSDAVIDERFSDDNVALDSRVHIWENRFGTFSSSAQSSEGAVLTGVRTAAKLTFQETDGDVVEISISKTGGGQVSYDGTLADLAVGGVSAISLLSAKILSAAGVGEGDIDLHNVELVQYITTIDLPQVNLTGVFSAGLGFRDLKMGNVGGPALFVIGNLPSNVKVAPALTFQNVSDVSIESLAKIRLIRAAQWVETDGVPDRIGAPGIANITIDGNLEASVDISTSSTLSVFSVRGFFQDATFTSEGNVGKVTVGGLDHANFFVGTDARPETVRDFDLVRSIASFTVRGVAGAASSFIASNVAASRIGSLSLTGIDPLSSADDFGIVADAIRSYVRKGGPRFGALSAPRNFDVTGEYSLKIV